MPRISRVAFAGFPHHIYQRGHRQQQVFFCGADREDYLLTLAECRESLAMRIYAYCLMDNHVHLIIDPGESGANLSKAMKRLAGRHSRRMNAMHGWRGSLWESRFKCSPIQTDRYLLTCGRYIDLNPVRARMVDRPQDYSWSSYRSRAGIETCPWLDADPAIEALAKSLHSQTGVMVINRSRGRPRKTEPETKQAPFGACLWGK
jgi:putative transposase